MRTLSNFTWSSLEDDCDKLFAANGYDAVKTYLDLVEQRPLIGIDMVKTNEAREYRIALLNKYKQIKL